jgi:hypothetical protein
MLGPVVRLMDHGLGHEMFYVVAVLLIAVGTVVRVRRAIVTA